MVSPRTRTVVIAVLMLLTFAARALPGPRTIDDAFITFRYSRNLVEGQGFVYNPGVHTLGTTTPLFALTMASISGLTGGQDFQWYAIAVSALADAGTVALLYLLGRRLIGSDWLAIFPAALWAISPMSVTFAIGGMETSLTIFWMVAATWAFVCLPSPPAPLPQFHPTPSPSPNSGREEEQPSELSHNLEGRGVQGNRRLHNAPTDRSMDGEVGTRHALPLRNNSWFSALVSNGHWREILIGLCAGLGLLTRIDAVLWIGPLFAYQLGEAWLKRRSLPWRTWLTCTLVLLPWVIFSTGYFGSPIPNSVTAKRNAYELPPFSALGQLLPTYSNVFFVFDTFGSVATMLSGLLVLALSLFALLYAVRRAPRALPFLIYPWLYMAFFVALNPLIFRWYMAPPFPALILSVFIGLWAMAQPLLKASARHFAYAVVGTLGLLCLFTSINAWTLHPDHEPDHPAPRMAWHEIELLYEQMGRYLHDELGVTTGTRVASGDIGAVGYFSQATIVDTVGLVTPELTRYYPVDPAIVADDQNYAIPPQLIYDTKPDYLVTMEGFVREGLEREARFQEEYELILEYPTDFYGTGMRLYRRR